MTVTILVGDARERLRTLPDESIHACITSPPYHGLRAYGGDPGMIGLEPTFDEHLENLVAVFREVRRVLRSDGVLFLNYGDAYAAQGSGRQGANGEMASRSVSHARGADSHRRPRSNVKPKDLMLMPTDVAAALRDDGWYLRSMIPQIKTNPMPESCKDRPTNAVEYWFLLTKAPRYFWDQEAAKEPVSGTANARAAKHNTAEARRARAREGTKGISTAEVRGITLPKPSSWATSPHYQNQDPRHAKRTPKDVDGRSARPPGVTPKSAPAGSGIRQNESYQAAMVDQPATRNMRNYIIAPTASFSGWVETFRLDRVASGDASGDMMHIVSLDCPEHAGLTDRVPKLFCGERVAGALSRTLDMHGRPFRVQQGGLVPTDPPDEHWTAVEKLDYWHLSYSPSARPHSTESHRTDLAHPSSPHATSSEESECRTAHTEPRPPDLASTPHDISSSKSVGNMKGANCEPQTASGTVGTSKSGSSSAACQCTFYQKRAEKTSHFATFAPHIIEPWVKAGTSEAGVCHACGAPWRRETEKRLVKQYESRHGGKAARGNSDGMVDMSATWTLGTNQVTTIGWSPTCACDAGAPVPATVLDPFGGAGTVGLVAERLGRDSILIEINAEYAAMARKRIDEDVPRSATERPPGPVCGPEDLPLFAGCDTPS